MERNMSYFSRLTDIVTCNLTDLLSRETEPLPALQAIIAEMEEGLAGAQRSVATAKRSVERIQTELAEQHRQVEHWKDMAKEALKSGDENDARLAIVRKQEIEDVAAGMEQQLDAATATAEHLATTQRALEARIAEARRKLLELESSSATLAAATSRTGDPAFDSANAERAGRVEAELEALRKEIG